MDSSALPKAETLERVKKVLRINLKLPADAPIADDLPLIGGEMDLDSLDALLLVTSIEKELGVKITGDTVNREVFKSVRTLAQFVDQAVSN